MLAPKQRYILVEYYIKGRSAKDISEEMGIAISSFHNNKARGLKAALKILRKSGFVFFCILVAVHPKKNCNNWVKKFWQESSKISRMYASIIKPSYSITQYSSMKFDPTYIAKLALKTY